MADTLYADLIVVGSGPGGATLARALARGAPGGRRVLLLERGYDQRRMPYYGRALGPLLYADGGSLLHTREGVQIVRPMLVGGATSMYCGCAAPPPAWLKERYQVDISAEVAEAARELGLAALPPAQRGAASTRIAEAARALGYAWQPQLKFIWPGRAGAFACGAHCMLGCRCGAKWSAAEFVDDARAAGARVLTGARVERVLHDGRRALGVAGHIAGRPFRALADSVVLAAGGIGSPRILQRSGFPTAGSGLTVDTTALIYGSAAEAGNGREPPMSWSWQSEPDGIMLSTLVDPWPLYPVMAARSSVWKLRTWPGWGRMLGIMVKLTDEVAGTVLPGAITKPLTARDRERLALGRGMAERILAEAGAARSSLFMTPLRGTHPGSSVRIDDLVDRQLQTDIAGLYVCDASVFPEALGRPTVLTIIGLALRLARHLGA